MHDHTTIFTRNTASLKVKSLLPKTAFNLYKLKKGLYLGGQNPADKSYITLYGGDGNASPSRSG